MPDIRTAQLATTLCAGFLLACTSPSPPPVCPPPPLPPACPPPLTCPPPPAAVVCPPELPCPPTSTSAAAPVLLSPAAETRAIETLLNDRLRTYNATDVPAMMKLYGTNDDFLVYHVVPPLEYDRTAFEGDFHSLFRMFVGRSVLTMSDLHIVVGSGDMAYARLLLNLKGKRRDGGATDLLMRITDVLRKHEGRWQIVHEHWSLPVDTETGQAQLHAGKTQAQP